MNGRKRLVVMIASLIVACAACSGVTILLLYRHTMAQSKLLLISTAQSQVHLIASLLNTRKQWEEVLPDSQTEDHFIATTLQPVIAGYRKYQGFGKTGEIVIARREGDKIAFILRRRGQEIMPPETIPLNSGLASPSGLALQGKSGCDIALDYQGKKVLAAYEPIPEWNLGIVVKMDLAEFNAPFRKAALAALGIGVLFVTVTSLLFYRVTVPILNRLEIQMQALSDEIEQRKSTEQTLKREQEFTRALLDNMADGVVACDRNGLLTLFNRTAREWHGVDALNEPADQWAQHYDLYHLDGTTPLLTDEIPLKRAFDGEQVRSASMAIMAKGQPPRFILANGDPFFDSQQHLLGSVVVMHDITEIKKAQEDLQHLNATLEDRVRERTEQLEASNRELESFSYSVSHDLRAPLRSIDGFSQALQKEYTEQFDNQARHYLDRIRLSASKMGRLIDDLLNLSRLTRVEITRKPINLSALIDRLVTEFTETHPDRAIEWHIAPGKVAQGDERLLETALRNLLSNALKFTAKHPCAHIEFGTLTDHGATVYYIRDDGAGFEMAYADKLFGAFQRLHKTDEFDGTGIGLAIVQRIVHRHGGRIWAQSAVEQGATFYFTLLNGDRSASC
jgi:signal transduction histidine kinase